MHARGAGRFSVSTAEASGERARKRGRGGGSANPRRRARLAGRRRCLPGCRLVSPEDDPLVEALTPRETQVLTLVADGLSNKAVAARLGVSDETVKFHLTSIFGKLGASNRTDAVRQGLRRGMVEF